MANYKPDENYNGKTKLRNWWPVIKKNIAWVVDIINDHVNGIADRHSAEQIDYSASQTVKVKIDAETQERQETDAQLRTNLVSETAARQNADTTLQTNINTEAQTRKNADDTLRTDLEAEAISRTDTDTELSGKIGDLSKLETIRKGNLVSAVNENKSVLDITRQELTVAQDTADTALETANTAQEAADSVAGTAEEARQNAEAAVGAIDLHQNDRENPHSVTKDQVGLGEVENVLQASKTEFDAQAAYTESMTAGLVLDVRQLCVMLGINLIDGGLFHEPQDGPALDGGDFDSEPTEVFDCGGFSPPAPLPVGDTVDGGNF